MAKDFTMMGRDLRNLSQLISPLIIGVVFALSLLRAGGEPPPGRGEAPAWFLESFRMLMGFGNVAIALFVGWIMLGRLAGMSFSREGKNFWMLKAAPVSPLQMLAAKFVGAFLPTVALAYVFVIGISLLQGVPIGQVLFLMLVVAFSLAGLSGILIAFGAAGANFKWDDPRRMNAGGLGCLGQVVTIVFLPISVALFLGPLLAAPALGIPTGYGYLAGFLLGAVGNCLCAYLPLRLVEKTVQRLDES
jgi:hypothetical protein